MKYEVMIRSRAKKSEPISEKHARFFAELSKMSQPWGIGNADIPEPPDPGSSLGAGVTISKLLGKGISGRVYYAYRREFEDLAAHDDFFDMAFNPEKVDYAKLVREEMPKMIAAFDAYIAQIGDVEFIYQDFDAIRASGVGDTRSGVYRIWPVSFFDKTLCERAFKIGPEEVVSRLHGHVESVSLICGGVYIVGSSLPLKIEEADKICWHIKRLITND